MFFAYTLIAFGACFLIGFVALTFIGAGLFLAREGSQLRWSGHEPLAGGLPRRGSETPGRS